MLIVRKGQLVVFIPGFGLLAFTKYGEDRTIESQPKFITICWYIYSYSNKVNEIRGKSVGNTIVSSAPSLR